MGFINLVSEDRASHRGIEPISGQLPHIALLFAVWKKLKRPQKSSKVLDRASHRRIEPISGQLPHIALLFAVWKKNRPAGELQAELKLAPRIPKSTILALKVCVLCSRWSARHFDI
jgi:hypothetical protein